MTVQNRKKQPFVFILFLLALLLPAAGQMYNQNGEENVRMGFYKLNRAPVPGRFVTGVAMKKLSKANFPGMTIMHRSLNGKFGRMYRLFKPETKRQVKLSVAVYGNVEETENAALEYLNTLSGVLNTGSRSGQTIGAHSWFMDSPDGSGVIVFVYDNSLFQIFSSDYSFAEKRARKIVKDLQAGQNGIQLGKQVPLPKVTRVTLTPVMKRGRQADIVVEGRDPEKRKLDYFVSTSAGRVTATAKRAMKLLDTEGLGRGQLNVYAINDLNVVSEVYIKKVEIKEDK